MGRKKSRPIRSGRLLAEPVSPISNADEHNLAHGGLTGSSEANQSGKKCKPIYIGVDRSNWSSDEHFDIAEILLKDINFKNGYSSSRLVEGMCLESSISVRFHLDGLEDDWFRLGHFPMLSCESISLEFIALQQCSLDDNVGPTVIFSGIFDGPDESVSGLVHLASQKLLTLRPIVDDKDFTNLSTFQLRVEILKRAFDASESLLEVPRQPWRKSMMNMMSWLRPEVTTSEAKYMFTQADTNGQGMPPEASKKGATKNHFGFDITGFYEAIKPSKEEPLLEDELPDLLPQLRPYQRRAAYWMVQREMGLLKSAEEMRRKLFSPLCVPVLFLERQSTMFYNPFCGTFSLHSEPPPCHIPGGILADEMGLGKTVELLACILSNHMPFSEDHSISTNSSEAIGREIKRTKQERVECVCGDVTENSKYKGLWVQCDVCDAWQHADCVGYLPRKKSRSSKGSNKIAVPENHNSDQIKRIVKTKNSSSVTEMDGNYVCPLCSELIEAARSPIMSRATLIVCPAPIIAQWQSEIMRHTRPGSLKTCIYEGARRLTSSATLINEMTELSSADIVLTTYDVLKEDLSHDSDRHDGDRRCMRFQKRYPVSPTLLTRIYWWRICLDEAQMVESNTAAVTEMALRLDACYRWCITGTPIQRKFDDIYGLLRFLGARPFDIYKWWAEVIRDPYEGNDARAMEFTHSFFKQIMWRSSKIHVSEELGLPPQEECTFWLSFSSVEEHFYRKQHETCMGFVKEAIEHFKEDALKRKSTAGDAFLSHNEAARFLTPLLKLRQACCHPQVGGSGIRTLQQSPMTMDEILEVLISKTKIEGEEALRRVVVALNGLAAISIIEQNHGQAVSLYREALTTAKENSEDFRLDPLLCLHIHHNLAEVLPGTCESLQDLEIMEICKESSRQNGLSDEMLDPHNIKRQKINNRNSMDLGNDDCTLGQHVEADTSPERFVIGADSDRCLSYNAKFDNFLKRTCEAIKQKYLSIYISKLSVARQEFGNSHTQIACLFSELRSQCENWWLEALDHIERDNDTSDAFLKRIENAILGASTASGSSRVSLRFRSVTGLKYTIQTGLDSLETSRKVLLDKLIAIDQTMDRPNNDDIERVRYCPNCQSGDGPLCVHCELDELFQVYEARLFCLKKGNSMMASAEEVVDFQRKRNELNLFFRAKKASSDSNFSNKTNKEQRHASSNIVVSRSPSDLEVMLGVIKNNSKAKVGREGSSSATKHLLIIETMRKEFAHARCLSRAQAQLLRAHDEIQMSISRLSLRETETEPTATNVLSKEEVIPSSMQFTSDKLVSLSSLARIKGQLRYLKGLVISKQKTQVPHVCPQSHEINDLDNSKPTLTVEKNIFHKANDEPCPICHEKLGNQKMVFQCGHVICCKCFLELTEQSAVRLGKSQHKWIMCPTCRQHTDFGEIAYVDDKQNQVRDIMTANSISGQDMHENSVKVEGSYGTKVEAITRKILWITSMDQEAKILVFSSWNDVLDVLEHAFRANSISYIRMKGGRKSQLAISQFKRQSNNVEGNTENAKPKSNSIQVLLLLVHHGANGLNLLEAQHVILAEPLLNPAAEAQAINRVHRIGQEKTTFVHRFLVRNTIEESIYKLNRSRSVNNMISAKSKNQDQPCLTLKDIECLFSAPHDTPEIDEPDRNLKHLPPAVAARVAAERRLMEASSGSSMNHP